MKNSKKILSVLMAVMIFFGIFSCATTVWAKEYNEDVESKAYEEKILTQTIEDYEEKAEITCELIEKREENSKTYKRADGTFTTVVSETPIHTMKGDKWVEIDNTLKNNEGIIKNKKGLYDIEFPETISENEKITIRNNGESIAFSVNNIDSAAAKVTSAETTDADVIEKDLSKTVSEITYESVDENTDVQYVISSDFVKENIIVNDKSGLQEKYSFDIEKGELTAKLDKDNNLLFKNKDKEVVFTIPAPVMTDANNAVSYDIDVEIKDADKSVLTLTYIPSKEWVESESRGYPVVIDPVIIMPDLDDAVIEDTAIINKTDDVTSKVQNYSNSVEGYLVNTQDFRSEVLVKINLDMFSFCENPNIEVTDVNYLADGYIIGGNVIAKPISGQWNSKTITYDDVYPTDGSTPLITYEDKIVDYFTGIPASEDEVSSKIYFNITDIFNEWLKGYRENNGFVLMPENAQTSGMLYLAGDYPTASGSYTFNTYCTIDYIDCSGSSEAFEYVSQDVGRAGVVSVNALTRGMTVSRNDLAMSGYAMPVNVGFNYGGVCNEFLEQHIAMVADSENMIIPYGNEWLPSNLQVIFQLSENQYQAFVGDGTVAAFNRKEETVDGTTSVVFELDDSSAAIGYELELVDESGNATVENLKLISPSGETAYFNEYGFCNEIWESDANSDGSYDKTVIEYDDNNFTKIDCVVDGAGRKYDFIYDNAGGLLSEIKCETQSGDVINAGTTNNRLNVLYSYDENNNLISVTYPDGKCAEYDYENNNLVKVCNIDGYCIEYTYDSLGKVTAITEKAGSSSGNHITFEEQGNRQVKITDAFSGTQIYQFGKNGKLDYIFDDKGNFSKTENADTDEENVFAYSDLQIVSENLLKNGSFEDVSTLNSSRAKHWSNEFEREINNDTIYGEYVYSVSSENNVTEFLEQSVEVENVSAYTLSAYVKNATTDSTQGKLYLKIIAENSSGDTLTKTQSIENAEDWTRVSVTFNPVTENDVFEVSEITACVGFENSCGDYYVDAIQLETGKGTAEYNLMENGSFNSVSGNSPDKWSESTVVEKSVYGKNVSALKLSGGLPYYTADAEGTYTLNKNISSVTQNVVINGKKGDIYSVGGWFNGFFDDNYINSDFLADYTTSGNKPINSVAQIKVSYNYLKTTKDDSGNETQENVTENFAVNFAPQNDSWQYAIGSFALKADVESVDVTVIAENVVSDSFVTGIELTSNNSAISFDEDEVSASDTTEDTTSAEDAEAIEECICENCEEADCTCRCETEELCNCIQCKRSSDIEDISNDGKTVTNKSYDGSKYMQSVVEYSDDKNYIISETDSNGISSAYTYSDSGVITSSAYGNGATTTYNSNAMGYLTLAEANVTGLTDNAVKMAINYAYDGDLLDKVTQGNVEYDYVYDEWGQLKSVLVDNSRIIDYTYGVNEKRMRISKIVFGSSAQNGFTIDYSYDNLTGDIDFVEKYNYVDGEKNVIKYEYIYNNLGELVAIKDNGTGHYIAYSDDGITIKNGENGDVIYELKDVTPTEDDSEETAENAPVTINQETANGVTYNHNIYDSAYDSVSGKTTETEAIVGGKTIGAQTVSDWFGRNESVTVMTKDPTDEDVTDYASVTSQYNYITEENVTTNLISSLNNTVNGENGLGSVNYSYTYDENGKITGITITSTVDGIGGTTQYIYDEAGQLIKETKGSDYVEYAYDSKGNISTRKKYSGNSLVSTDNFVYGADSWEDKLTGYNNKTITYDSIGNPTSYLGATLTWRGRELASYEKGNKQISYSYDVDGMRYQKVVKTNGTETSRYDYVYSEGKLILITYTENGASDTARFIYDSMGEPRGFILNNTATYLYIKNAQGDITGIVNEDGDVILTCSYDAWGKVTFASTNMEYMALAAKLSKINPFTYRGYCYDYDIEMYYLQSRYYDPEICRFINADSTDYLGATGTLLSYNLFAYCENEPVNRVDPKGTKYNISTTYYVLPDIYFLTTRIDYLVGNKIKKSLSTFYILQNGIVTISNSVPALKRIIKNKWSYYLAKGIYKAAKKINSGYLKGRTVKGIQFEILVHYYASVLGILPDSSDYSDIGGIDKDKNAGIFEMGKYLDYLSFLASVSNPALAFSVVMLFVSYL